MRGFIPRQEEIRTKETDVAHPNRKEAAEGANAKMRRMTMDYGSASGPANNIPAESNRLKGEGPEDSIGFGADASAPKARGDRSKRTSAANPVSTYRKGGRVKKRADGGDVSPIEEANRDQAMSKPAERARGGRTKGKGTHVNVIVAPQGGAGPMGGAMPPPVLPVGGPPGMPPGAPPMMPPKPPMAGPPMGGAMPPPGMGGAPGAPGGMPPGLMPPRAKGGRVKHADEAEDKALIMKTLKSEGLTRSDKPEKMGIEERARGGKIEGYTAGAASGEGRLEKIENYGRKTAHEKPQTV